MDTQLKDSLISLAKGYYSTDDPSHDFEHIMRVLKNAKNIVQNEGGDMDIIFPAVLFHDAVNYPKNSPKAKRASEESSKLAMYILRGVSDFPQDKVREVGYAISVCSFSKGIMPQTFEAKVLQDADGLEATGVVAIMRTFASTGQMKRPFYDPKDPFCQNREPNGRQYALDLFYQRLLKIEQRCHTETARQIAQRRTIYVREFLSELELELTGM